MENQPRPGQLGLISMLFVLIAFLPGCQNSGPVVPRENSATTLVVTTVANRQQNQTRTVARVRTSGGTNRTAELLLDNELLPFTRFLVDTDSAYTKLFNSFRRYLPASVTLSLDDKSGNSASLTFPVVDSFTLTGVAPQSRIANGNQPVIMSWTGAPGAATYVMAAVRRGNAYLGKGFAQYATSGSTSETLNQIAFYQTDGINPDTGWYDLYVYAIAGIPDSASTARVLPVPLPLQQGDNLSRVTLTGHYGSISVSKRDSMRIAVQP